MSRLLLPAEYGIVAMAAPVLAFMGLFNNLGLAQAVVQKERITQRDLNSLFWLGLALSSACALIAAALSPLVGLAYHQPAAGQVCAALALQMPLGALAGHASALMSRRMQFGAMAIMEVTSALVGFVVSLVCALLGCSYWSLVIGQLASSVVSVIGDRQLSGWRPSRPGWSASAFPMLRFGANLTGYSLLSTFSLYADNALVGFLKGPAALGLFDKAFSLVLRPLSSITAPIGRVATPLLSRLNNEPETYRRTYLSILQAILLLALPGLVVGSTMTGEIVGTLLGRRWLGSAPVMSFICVAAMFTPLAGSSGWLFTSQGRPSDQLRSGVISSSLIFVSMLAGLPWGPTGIAASYALFAPAVHGCPAFVATRRGPVRLRDVLGSVYPMAVGAGAAAVAVILLRPIVGLPHLVRIAGALAVAYGLVVGVVLLFPDGRKSARILFKLMSAAAPRIRRPATVAFGG